MKKLIKLFKEISEEHGRFSAILFVSAWSMYQAGKYSLIGLVFAIGVLLNLVSPIPINVNLKVNEEE